MVTTDPTPVRSGNAPHLRRLLGAGLLATAGAVVATTALALLARGVGADLEVGDPAEAIPVPGIAVMTGIFSIVGVVMAAAFLRWSGQPGPWFVRTAVALTVLSLVPPLLLGNGTATIAALVGLHLIAAAVMIPALARSLRAG